MKTIKTLLALLALLGGPAALAQEKARPTDEFKPVTPLRVQVLLTEFDGDKKISSLPYTLLVNADERFFRPITSLRLGVRVPVNFASEGKQSFQYMDVGTNIDCQARAAEDGRFRLDLTVERSSIYSYSGGPEKKSLEGAPGDLALGAQPILRQFKTTLPLLMRDGQTVQSTVATDPLSGRVLKVDVTLNVVK